MNPTNPTVATAVQQYLDENGFTVEEYTKPTVTLDIGPFSVTMKNGAARQHAIPLHDMHHVATGYGTDLIGEAEVGVWELRAGCNNAFLVAINFSAAVLGFFLSPSRMWRAWKNAKGSRSLYVVNKSREELGALTLSELRALTQMPANGVGDLSLRRLHAKAPANVTARPSPGTGSR